MKNNGCAPALTRETSTNWRDITPQIKNKSSSGVVNAPTAALPYQGVVRTDVGIGSALVTV